MRVACRLPNSGTTWLRVAERTCVRLMPCENVCTCGLQDAHICRPFSHGILFVDSSMPSPAAVPHFVDPCCAPSVSARHFTVSQLLLAITRCRVEGCSWPWTMLHTTADNVAHGRGQRCTRPWATRNTRSPQGFPAGRHGGRQGRKHEAAYMPHKVPAPHSCATGWQGRKGRGCS